MSRIDDALKRARAHKSEVEAPQAVADPSTVESPVVPAWQYERFPAEDSGGQQVEQKTVRTGQPAATPKLHREGRATSTSVAVRYATAGVAPQFSEKIVGGAGAVPSREQYARVAAALHQAQRRDKTAIAMIASAVPGEGKTLTAANIALTLSESYGRRVLLIDADLRKPTLHELFQVSNAKGLLDGLEAGTEQPMALIEVTPRLSVLPAGRSASDPMS